ncbi:MAG: NAD-dependent deacylase [Lentisphaeria bacterium]|nr:NAD-dependent deacylase [Lentisphaeria bacterium]
MPEANQPEVQRLASFLHEAQCIAFLTGAGMSTESGIPDFRSPTGVYANRPNGNVFDIDAFKDDPGAFYAFIHPRYREMLDADPNPGHLAIVALEEEFGKQIEIATQNIDMLHERAGSSCVHTLHGTIEYATCMRCGDGLPLEEILPRIEKGRVPRHSACGGVMKPDIVFFGEQLPVDKLMASQTAMEEADLVIIVGTSLVVHPAAALPCLRRSETKLAILNKTPTYLDEEADVLLREPAGEVLPAVLRAMRELSKTGGVLKTDTSLTGDTEE